MPLDSRVVLEKLGYSFEFFEEPPSRPEVLETRFEDIHSAFSETRLAGRRLYRHQAETLKALREGCNVILVAGTGSGKTEAWFLYVVDSLRRGQRVKVLAVYPTLALAHDQLARLREYGEKLGLNVLALDAGERDRLSKLLGSAGLRRAVLEADIVVTNPAFLLNEVKRLGEGREPLLSPFLRKPGLYVIDELDFYGPRGHALLDAMLRVVAFVAEEKPQVAVLTATLSNPDELGEGLKRVTGRCYRVVRGRPFRPPNRVYIVLGKDLEGLWRRARSEAAKLTDVPPDVREALEDFESFRRSVYKVVAVLRALGASIPEPRVDIVEILAEYVNDDGVTLVFTRSIATAERLARALRERLGDRAGLVATHHHLVSREERSRVEEAARKGEIRVIFSPRTLSQGIDIGTVVRVVHVGLPEDVREFVQREGRKGRREGLEFTESIIVPAGLWDRELLDKGVEALKEWLSLGLEKVIINPENLYASLFTGLWKLQRRLYNALDESERRALRAAGVLDENGRLNQRRLKWVWERLNFYEFGPPYGVKRYLVHRDGRSEPLEPIGFCDLVEHFQEGCIDLANEAIVTGFKRGGRGFVTAVIEEPITEADFYRHPALADAVEEYTLLKKRWGEEPNIKRDMLRGAVVSQAIAVVHPPKRGFGRLRKIPNRVLWIVHGEKPLVLRGADGETVVTERRGVVYITGETAGAYTDYTYGYVVELPPWEDPSLARLGLALITIVLRKKFGIPFETIVYSVDRLGDYKAVSLHEPEAAGIIEKLDWRSVLKAVEEYEPSSLDTALLSLVDEVGYAEFLGRGGDWRLVKEAAIRVARLLAESLAEKHVVEVEGVRLEVPKPGPEQRILSAGAVLDDSEKPRGLLALVLFDGENVYKWSGSIYLLPGVKPDKELRMLEMLAQELVDYEGFTLVVPSEGFRDVVQSAGLRLLARVAGDAVTARELWSRIGLPEEKQPIVTRAVAERLGWRLPDAILLAADAAEARSRGSKPLRYYEEAAEALARISYIIALLAKARGVLRSQKS